MHIIDRYFLIFMLILDLLYNDKNVLFKNIIITGKPNILTSYCASIYVKIATYMYYILTNEI